MMSVWRTVWSIALLISNTGKHAGAQSAWNESADTQDGRGLDSDAAFGPNDRRLAAANLKITVLPLYVSGTTTSTHASMESFIEDAYVSTNAAFAKSGISLTIVPADVETVPSGWTRDISNARIAMKRSQYVQDLRNKYTADLVQLFGDFADDQCGNGDLPIFEGQDSSELNPDQAFSAVTVGCIEDELFSHSHELAHSLGCNHDKDNTDLNQHNGVGLEEYAHGQLNCVGPAANRYVTIMSYILGDCVGSSRANFFSNPDIEHNGWPTGATGTADNARVIKANMLEVSRFRCADTVECEEGDICCPDKHVCGEPGIIDPEACGDPHMTGFRGQKFDFKGEDGAWYALLSDLPAVHLAMRITAPVPSLPEITYITGISLITTDFDGLEHTVVIAVKDPHSLVSTCSEQTPSCLADGALNVVLDGEEELLSPGTISLAPGVTISAVNLPGACRSFGFETYWESKKLERTQGGGRRLQKTQLSMAEWILGDPTATNMEECTEYVAQATVADEDGLFAHQSEHGSFQIVTPKATIRLSHGRLHQVAMRDPTDRFDLPDHLTWQMNLAIDHNAVSPDATGILGETMVPTRDGSGNDIMSGMGSIRGSQEEYRVAGPLEVVFAQGARG